MESKKEAVEVAFAVDRNTEECAYVAIHSMLLRASCPMRIILMHPAGENVACGDWVGKLERLGNGADVKVKSVDVSKFIHCKNLYDSHASYLKVYAPDFANGKRLICSDTDVVFNEDISKLADMELGDAIIARNGGEPCALRGEVEKEILFQNGRSPEDQYYGSGLSVINVEKYRNRQKKEMAEDVGKKYSHGLKYQEQTVWNCIFSQEESMSIEARWCQTPPIARSVSNFKKTPGIIHFAGSPKPWDLFGEFVHPSYSIWMEAADRAGIPGYRLAKYTRQKFWKRAWRIRNQYKQCSWKVPDL
jgi:lipopolysaccharide biosynthesis glycosyltransferase